MRDPASQGYAGVNAASGVQWTENAAGAAEILAAKVPVASEMRSAQWSAVPTWVRERAYFMAAVDRAAVLDGFQEAVAGMERGELSLAEARKRIRSVLDRHGYEAEPGEEGTIKDLRAMHRQNVALETNLLQVQGFSRWARQQATLADWPAQQLVRERMATAPRNWGAGDPQNAATKELETRWTRAIAETTQDGATGPERMVALVNHPVWAALSRFGTPYPPFDFNSGMGIEPIDAEEAEELGILPGEDASEEHKEMMKPRDVSLNETLEAAPEIRTQAVRTELAEHVQGLARWETEAGEPIIGAEELAAAEKPVLRFTDPNGTQRHTAAELAEMWEALPEEIPALQRDAIQDWLTNEEGDGPKPGSDAWSDLVRGVARVWPEAGTGFRDITAIWESLGGGMEGFDEPIRVRGILYKMREIMGTDGPLYAVGIRDGGAQA